MVRRSCWSRQREPGVSRRAQRVLGRADLLPAEQRRVRLLPDARRASFVPPAACFVLSALCSLTPAPAPARTPRTLAQTRARHLTIRHSYFRTAHSYSTLTLTPWRVHHQVRGDDAVAPVARRVGVREPRLSALLTLLL